MTTEFPPLATPAPQPAPQPAAQPVAQPTAQAVPAPAPQAYQPAPQPEPEPAYEAQPGEAAAAQELEASGDYVVAPLCGVPVRVLMSPRWRASHFRMLRDGDNDGFMAAILEDDGYQVYLEADPDQEQQADFMKAISDASKEALGKSGGRSASSRNTRRR